MDKNIERQLPGQNRQSGGLLLAVLSCGHVVDFVEIWKGESLYLAYALAWRSVQLLEACDASCSAVVYDNACKLEAMVQRLNGQYPPFDQKLARTPMVLDRWHKVGGEQLSSVSTLVSAL